MLRVSVNLKQGVYVISEDDGQKEVRMPMSGRYDKETISTERKSILKARRWIPSEKLNMIDVGVYQALREFDSQYGTNHAEKYIDVTTKQITYNGFSESKKDYEKRSTAIKTKEFSDAGINIQYNLSLFGKAKDLGFKERLQAIKLAFTQRQNGVRVHFSDSKKQLLEAPAVVPVIKPDVNPDIIEDDIPDMPDEETLTKIREEVARIQAEKEPVVQPILQEPQPVVQPTPQGPQPVVTKSEQPQVAQPKSQPQPEPKPKKQVSRSKSIQAAKRAQREQGRYKNLYQQRVKAAEEEKRVAAERAQAEGITIPEEPKIDPIPQAPITPTISEEPKPITEQPILPDTKKEEPTEPQTRKKVSRSKSIQASKRAQREQSRYKNSYQQRIKAKETKKAEAERRAAQGPKTKAEEAPKPQAPQPKPEQPKTIGTSKGGTKPQEGSFITRFTRKVKEKADSIRNKKYIPKLNDKQRKIVGAVTAVALAATLAIGTGAILSSSNSETIKNQDKSTYIPQIVQTMSQEPTTDTDSIDYLLNKEEQESQTPSTQTPSIQEQVQPTIKDEKDSKQEYLSSIKVGTAMSIDNGRYFETPEGQGNFGYFENYTNGVKEINMIDVITEDGYKVVTTSDVSVYELKQQYPNARFAYHIVCRNQDGSTITLGWLTEDSLDQNMQQEQNQHHGTIEMDEEDR